MTCSEWFGKQRLPDLLSLDMQLKDGMCRPVYMYNEYVDTNADNNDQL